MWNVIPENKKPQRSDAENACTENLHWIFDISSRWSKVRYLSAPIKRKHGYKLGRTRIEFRARNHVNESLVTVNLSMYCYRLWVVPPFRRSPSCESKKLKHSYKLGRTGIEFRARNHVIFDWRSTHLNYVKMWARCRERSEVLTSIFSSLNFPTCATDFAEKEGLLVA